MPRELRAGDRGPDVLALQQALHKALGAEARNNQKGDYGSKTVHDVHLFKLGWTKQTSGEVFGSNAWGHIEKYIGLKQQRLLKEAQHLEAQRAAETQEQKIRGLIVAEAVWMLANRGMFVYRQFRPYPSSLRILQARDECDCSSSCTLWYKAGGAVDPNGLGYSGQGYTGTLWGRGEAVQTPAPTDLCFYGNMGNGIPSHVAMCVEPGYVISFGHTPVSKYPVNYRPGEFRGARHYPVT